MSKDSLSLENRQVFSNCWKREGSVDFSLFKNEKILLSAMLDWMRENGTFRWEISDALGRTLASGELVGTKMHTEGRLKDFLSKIEIRDNGLIFFDGNELPLTWKELNCFLNFHVPLDWLDLKLSQLESSIQSPKVIRFEDKDRIIDLGFGKNKICGILSTRIMGVFKRERLTWCFMKEESGSLDLEKIIRLEWKNGEEKESEWKNYSK